MSAGKRVVFAFKRGGEGTDAAQLAVGAELVAPSGQYLVSVGLMSDVPYEAVVGRVEDVVQCHRQLHDTERRGKVPRVDSHLADDVVAQFAAYLRQLLSLQLP